MFDDAVKDYDLSEANFTCSHYALIHLTRYDDMLKNT